MAEDFGLRAAGHDTGHWPRIDAVQKVRQGDKTVKVDLSTLRRYGVY
jgi:hypothetical protein